MKRKIAACLLLFWTLLFLPAATAGAVEVYGWGRGWYDQLGPGGEEKNFHPVRLQLPDDIIAVKSGSTFGLALDLAGRVWAWGRRTFGVTGRPPDPARVEESSPVPAVVPGLPPVKAIAAGDEVALALAADGTVWIWGDDTFGIHGYGHQRQPLLPPHRVPGLSNIVRIALFNYHGLALRADGTVWAWGNNSFGECGVDPEPEGQAGHIRPRQVQNLDNIIAIAAGENTSYALRIDGTLFLWGRQDVPGATLSQYNPVVIPAAARIVQISTAPWTGYIRDVNGTAWAVGAHGGGCLNATAACALTAVPARMAKAPRSTIMSGNYEVALFVQPDGSLLVIGDNYHAGLGQVYDGTAWNPLPLAGIRDVFAVDAGYYTPLVATGLKCHALLSADARELEVIKANILGRAYYLKFTYQPAGGQVRYRLADIQPVPTGACGSEATLLLDGDHYLLHLPWVEYQGQFFWANFVVAVENGQVFIVYRDAGRL